MRTLIYWLTSTVVAVLAAGASELGVEEGSETLWTAPQAVEVMAVPEPSRAFLLGVGIMAIAFTYRQAWMNWKRKV